MANGNEYEITVVEMSGQDMVNYPIKLVITHPKFFEVCNLHQYIEIYDSDGTTPLDFYVDMFDLSINTAIIFIRIPNLSANEERKIYLKVNKERTEALSDPSNVFNGLLGLTDGVTLIADNFEACEVGTQWDIKESYGSVGIKTDKVYEGECAIGSDQGGGQGGGENVYDQNHYFAKISVDSLNASSVIKWEGYDRRWKDTTYQGHFCGFGVGGSNELYNLPHDNTWHKHEVLILFNGINIWRFIFYEDGVFKKIVKKQLSFTDSFTFGIQTRHNGGYDNSIYVRTDLVTVKRYDITEPLVICPDLQGYPTYDFVKRIADVLGGVNAPDPYNPCQQLYNWDNVKLDLHDETLTFIKSLDYLSVDTIDTLNSIDLRFSFRDDSVDHYVSIRNYLFLHDVDLGDIRITDCNTWLAKSKGESLPILFRIVFPYNVNTGIITLS